MRIGSWKTNLCPQTPLASPYVPWGTLQLRDNPFKFLPCPILCPFCLLVGTMGEDSKRKALLVEDRVQGVGSQEALLIPTLKSACCRNKGKSLLSGRQGPYLSSWSYFNSRVLSEKSEDERTDKTRIWEKVKKTSSISPWPDLLVLTLEKVTHAGPPRTAHHSWPTTPIFSPDLVSHIGGLP